MGPAHDTDALLVDEGQSSEVVQCSIGIDDTLGHGHSLRIGTDLLDAAMEEAVDFHRDVAPFVQLGSPQGVTGLRSATAMKQNEGREGSIAVWLADSAGDRRAVGLQGNGVASHQQQSNDK